MEGKKGGAREVGERGEAKKEGERGGGDPPTSNLKPQISNLKSSIVNPQTSNLKISNPNSLGWAA